MRIYRILYSIPPMRAIMFTELMSDSRDDVVAQVEMLHPGAEVYSINEPTTLSDEEFAGYVQEQASLLGMELDTTEENPVLEQSIDEADTGRLIWTSTPDANGAAKFDKTASIIAASGPSTVFARRPTCPASTRELRCDEK